jgi:hypothetical protein
VDVFERRIEREPTRFEVGEHAFEAGHDRVGVGLRDHAALAEHARVRDRAADVVAGQLAVEVDRRGEALDDGVGARLEAPAPRLVLGHTGRKSRKAPSVLQVSPLGACFPGPLRT